ncbi:regulator of G-protein signaling 5-like [Ahaetulla prasina]|uniref:regulator of G-protein signaling 5-like n=1 Tax=Ahaetulla prasina TaxID=499056 RepID=UPI002647D366|nr:regulator of G-protein signaling 5-like [Ahaetulla prasina]
MCKGLAALPHTCLERAKEIKTKLGTLLQKPDSSIDLIIPYPEKPAKVQKPSPEEAWQWRNSLEKLLQNPCKSFVNIDHFTKSVTMKNLVEPSVSTFDLAQKRIFMLMEKDSLPRFVRSNLYEELVK